MAKLLKADTARKRAEAVDKTENVALAVIDVVNEAIADGDMSATVVIPGFAEDRVVTLLESAGYSVTYPLYGAALQRATTAQEAPSRNWFQKLFGLGNTVGYVEDFQFMKGDKEYLCISWAKQEDAPEQLEFDFA